MGDHKNTIIAIVLSLIVVVGWQYFVGYPQMEKQREQALLKQQEQAQTQPGTTQPNAAQPGATPGAGTPSSATPPPVPGAAAPAVSTASREAVIAASPRIAITTPTLRGSIDLKGGRIDDLSLEHYRETTDPTSPAIVLGSRRRHHRGDARPGRAVATGGLGRAAHRPSGDAELRQRRGLDLPPHHRGRRALSVHAQGRGGEQERQPGHAVSLCAGLAARHAEGARLLHSA
jgi:YidC/Oxa1 family membrane protein insertase